MVDVAHFLDRLIHPLQPAVSVILLGLLLWAFVIFFRARRDPSRARVQTLAGTFGIPGVSFAAILLAQFFLADFIYRAAWIEVEPKLAGRINGIWVNGTPLDKPDGLANALRAIRQPPGHHSHPTVKFHIAIATDRGDITLELERDSGDPHDYWVSYDGFYATPILGGISTAALDTISPAGQQE